MPLVTAPPQMRAVVRARRALRSSYAPIVPLVVTLIGLPAGAVALIYSLTDLSRSERSLCRANMRALARAEERYRRQSGARRYTSDVNALIRQGDIPFLPVCPSGGHYRILIGPSRTRGGGEVPDGSFAVEDDT